MTYRINATQNASLRTKRKVFFSFHYDDIMRVNNVRNAWKIDHPDRPDNRSFYDSSLWEANKLTDPDRIKALIREGVDYTSVVCVLVGTGTWQRRWVKYEIARSVIDGKGLLAVHVNGINHHQRRTPDPRGFNPIAMMGIAMDERRAVFLCEQLYDSQARGYRWKWYADYANAITVPRYVRKALSPGDIVQLSTVTREYDFVQQQGHKNIGGWVDLAASDADR